MIRKMRREWNRKIAALASSALMLMSGSALAADPVSVGVGGLPDKYSIQQGKAEIGVSVDKSTMTINQSTGTLLIDWNTFNINEGKSVHFNQQADWMAINNVIGGTMSNINGSLTGNGTIVIVNPNGISFGGTANVNVGSLIASTMGVMEDNLNQGRFTFSVDSLVNKKYTNDSVDGKINKNNNGRIYNDGNITAKNGVVALISRAGIMNFGNINAVANGKVLGKDVQAGVYLAAGEKIILSHDSGSNKILFDVSVKDTGLDHDILSSGQLGANDGYVLMSAGAANSAKASVVNNTGIIQAKKLTKNADGSYSLVASGKGIKSVELAAGSQGQPNANSTGVSTAALGALTGSKKIGEITIKSDSTVDVTGNLIAANGISVVGSKNVTLRNAAMAQGGKLTIESTNGAVSVGKTKINTAEFSVQANGDAVIKAKNNVCVNSLISAVGTANVTSNAGSVKTGEINALKDVIVSGKKSVDVAGIEAGLLEKDSEGNVTVSQKGNATVNAKEGKVTIGAVEGNGNLTINSKAVTAKGNIEVTGDVVMDNSGATYQDGIGVYGDITAGGNVSLKNSNVGYMKVNNIAAQGDVSLISGTGIELGVDAEGNFKTGTTTISGKDVKLDASNVIYFRNDVALTAANDVKIENETKWGKLPQNRGMVEDGKNVTIRAGHDVKINGMYVKGTIDVDAANDVTIQKGANAGNTLELDAGRNVTLESLAQGVNGIAVNAGGDVSVTGDIKKGDGLVSGGSIGVTAGDNINLLGVKSGTNVDISAGKDISTGVGQVAGTYKAFSKKGDITVNDNISAEYITLRANHGAVATAQNTELKAVKSESGKDTIPDGFVKLWAEKAATVAGTINADTGIIVNGGSVAVSETGKLHSGSQINLTATDGDVVFAGSLVDSRNISMQAEKSVKVQSDIAVSNDVNLQAGEDVSLSKVNAGHKAFAQAGKDVQLNGNIISGAKSDGAVVLVAGQKFVNNAGTEAIQTKGSWQVYSANASDDAFGGLNSNNYAVWGTGYDKDKSYGANLYFFTGETPTFTVTANDATKDYGIVSTGAGFSYASDVTGKYSAPEYTSAFKDGAVSAAELYKEVTEGEAKLDSAGFAADAAAGTYAINVSGVTGKNGYNVEFKPGTLTVNAKTDTTETTQEAKAASNVPGSGAIGTKSAQALNTGVDRVLGLADGKLPMFKVANKRMSNYGTYEIASTPDAVKLTAATTKKTPSLPVAPATDDNYRQINRTLVTENGNAQFSLTYNGATLNVYPTDDAAKALVKSGEETQNVELLSKALFTSQGSLGVDIADLDGVVLYADATESEAAK